MFTLLLVIVVLVLSGLLFATANFRSQPAGSQPPAGFMTGLAVFGLLWLAIVIPSLAVQVRRFNDQNKSR